MLFIDTDIAIDIIHGRVPVPRLRDTCRGHGIIALAAPSVLELFAGLFIMKYRKKDPVPKAKIEMEEAGIRHLLGCLHHVPFDHHAAEASADLFHRLARGGQQVDMFDCMIASIVMRQDGGALVTRNVDHFSRIPGLTLVALA